MEDVNGRGEVVPVHIRESTELATLAKARLSNLEGERALLESRRAEIDAELERVLAETRHLEGLLAIYGAGSTDRPARVAADPDGSMADRVIALLREVRRPLHYREIERQLRSRGLYFGGGKDPANTLLAKYFDDPRLFRPSRGTYALREWNPSAASVGAKPTRRNRKGA